MHMKIIETFPKEKKKKGVNIRMKNIEFFSEYNKDKKRQYACKRYRNLSRKH